ncbi:MAG: hypothetical protein ABI673_08050 [Novosphingobium sp.]
MFAILLLATARLLNLEDGQAYEVVSQLDCSVYAGTIDLHGAASTSSMGSGKKRVSLMFSTLWPADKPGRKIGLLAVETEGETTTLQELDYTLDYVPIKSNVPQPVLAFVSGATFYSLSPRDGSSKWVYEERQVLVHGATQTYEGICEVRKTGE